MNRLLLAATALVLSILPAAADFQFTQGSGPTAFDFTCFTSKHCFAHVNITSAGVEVFTIANPGQVTVANSSIAVTGTFFQATQPVSLASVPSHAVTNAGTFAVQNTAATPAGTNVIGHVIVDTAPSTAVTNAGTFAVQNSASIVGQTASGSALTGNPVRVGISDGTNAQNWLAAIALADGVNGNNTAAVAGWLWNGTTYDRARGSTAGAFNIIRDAAGNARGANVNASNQLSVSCDNGCSSSSAITGWAGGTLGAMANFGTTPGAVLVPGMNAAVISSVLPTGAGTAANQATILATLGAPGDTVCATATGTCSWTALLKYNNNTSPVLAASTAIIGKVGVDQTTPGTTNGVSPSLTNAVWGTTSAMTGTTSTSLIAGTTSKLTYVTSLICGNSSATVGTFVTIQDGSGGTTLGTVPAAAVFGGAVLTAGGAPLFPPTTSGNGVFVADVTTGANVICAASGFHS